MGMPFLPLLPLLPAVLSALPSVGFQKARGLIPVTSWISPFIAFTCSKPELQSVSNFYIAQQASQHSGSNSRVFFVLTLRILQ